MFINAAHDDGKSSVSKIRYTTDRKNSDGFLGSGNERRNRAPCDMPFPFWRVSPKPNVEAAVTTSNIWEEKKQTKGWIIINTPHGQAGDDVREGKSYTGGAFIDINWR